MATPAKGKRFVKVITNPETGRKKKISFGQAGKAKDGKDRIRRGTKKGDGYCARSLGIRKKMKAKFGKVDKNSPNELSRKKWGCIGAKSVR